MVLAILLALLKINFHAIKVMILEELGTLIGNKRRMLPSKSSIVSGLTTYISNFIYIHRKKLRHLHHTFLGPNSHVDYTILCVHRMFPLMNQCIVVRCVAGCAILLKLSLFYINTIQLRSKKSAIMCL